MPCPRMPQGGIWQQAKAKDKMGLTESRGASSRKQEKAEPGNAARCDGRCNALRWPLQRAAFSAPFLCLARDGVAFAPLHAIPSKRAVRWKTPHSSFCSDRECRIQGYVADQRWRGITAFHLAQFLTLQKTDAPPRLPYPTWPSPGGWLRWHRDGCSHPSGERPDACR